MELGTKNSPKGNLYPKGFDLDMYEDMIRALSGGIITELPSGGIKLLDRRITFPFGYRGIYNPHKERILLNSQRISSVEQAGETLAHETRHYIDYKTQHPSVKKRRYYPIAQGLSFEGMVGSVSYAGASSLGSALELVGVEVSDTFNMTPSHFGATVLIGGISVAVHELSYRAYWNDEKEARARDTGTGWGGMMALALADVDLKTS